MTEQKSKVVGADSKRDAQIKADIAAFLRTAGGKHILEYGDQQREMLLQYAEEMAMPHPDGSGKKIPIDGNTANYLLQNRRGIGIITTYVRLYGE
jgi:hypothetical protein